MVPLSGIVYIKPPKGQGIRGHRRGRTRVIRCSRAKGFEPLTEARQIPVWIDDRRPHRHVAAGRRRPAPGGRAPKDAVRGLRRRTVQRHAGPVPRQQGPDHADPARQRFPRCSELLPVQDRQGARRPAYRDPQPAVSRASSRPSTRATTTRKVPAPKGRYSAGTVRGSDLGHHRGMRRHPHVSSIAAPSMSSTAAGARRSRCTPDTATLPRGGRRIPHQASRLPWPRLSQGARR